MLKSLTGAICILFFSSIAYTQTTDHALFYVPNADNESVQGFIRITNADSISSLIQIRGIDDKGVSGENVIQLVLNPLETIHLNSNDLENTNPSKGVLLGLGDGTGDWRLLIEGSSELQVMSYIRTVDGFLNDMHDVVQGVPSELDVFVPIFNPGPNRNQISRLRISNDSEFTNRIALIANDDNGDMAEEPVTLIIPPFEVAEIDAFQLENGMDGFTSHGSAGNGKGKWKMLVTSTHEMTVMNLLQAGNYISNLSGASYDVNQIDALFPDDFYTNSFIIGNFEGWNGQTEILLEDGTKWRQIEDYSGTHTEISGAAVSYLKMKNDWFLWVEESDYPVKVEPID